MTDAEGILHSGRMAKEDIVGWCYWLRRI